MPGPVSDTYDPEFSTGANRQEVIDAMREQADKISDLLGSELKNIVAVVQDEDYCGAVYQVNLTERELRILRYALNAAVESVSL